MENHTLSDQFKRTLPYVLQKAMVDDPWSYTMGTVDGKVWFFTGLERHCEDFVMLKLDQRSLDEMSVNNWFTRYIRENSVIMPNVERGTEISLDHIVWLQDAPFGS